MSDEKTDIIGEILRNYDILKDKSDIENFVSEQLRSYGVCRDESEASTVSREICEMIDALDDGFQDLRNAKKKGKSRQKWLEKQLEESLKKVPDGEKTDFIREMKTALADVPLDIIESKTGQKPGPISEPLKSFEFKDINKTAIAKNLLEDIRTDAMVRIVADEKAMQYPPDAQFPELGAVKEFFERPLDSTEDRDMKKTVAASAYIAKERGLIKSLENKSSREIAAIADYGVTGAKVAYKVGTGEMNDVDAIDYMVDKATAAVVGLVKKIAPAVGESIGKCVGERIGSFFGPAGTRIGAQIGKEVGFHGGKWVAKTMEKGIHKAGNAVKKVARNVWTGAKKVASSILDKISNIF